jgi:DNA repair protein RecO (recombination protein O)
MAEWSDIGIALALRKFGETDAIMDVFGREQGRARGLVKGGVSRAKRAAMAQGNTLALTWRARTQEQLGFFALAEPEVERSARHLDDPAALSAMTTIAEILLNALPEGEAKPGLYDASTTLLDALALDDVWPALFVRWEMGLLSMLGFGLDLSTCAISGANDGLTHVSPRTGRAVRGSEAEEYLDRLLPLPAFLVDSSAPATPDAVAAGFRLTGHFLSHRLFADLNRPAPEARSLMIDRLVRAGRVSPGIPISTD